MGAAMHMVLARGDQMNYEIVCPSELCGHCDPDLPNHILAPFSEEVIAFVDAFSRHLFESPSAKKFPELMALAFWMRRGRVEKIKNDFEYQHSNKVLLGRGVVFHIAPANVDTLFIYSWFLSLLVGNSNIIRLSSKTNAQLAVLIDTVNNLFEQDCFSVFRKRTLLVRYDHDDEVTGYFSSRCDVRVIWGGDTTIQHIRSIPIPPTAVELPFADKFSLAVIDALAFVQSNEQQEVVNNFYNDAYWFGQMACSSPRLVVWVGAADAVDAAQQIFWELLEKKVFQATPDLSAADVMNKYVASGMMAIDHLGVTLKHDEHGWIHRVQINSLEEVDEQKHCGAGLFFEAKLDDLKELALYFNNRNQTVTYYGIKQTEWQQLVKTSRPNGVDRIVPIGQALNFSVTWDGVDLLSSFCREVSIEP